jgi:hypothetical protein
VSILTNRQLQNVDEGRLGRCMQKLAISDFDYPDTDYYWRCNALNIVYRGEGRIPQN